MKIDLVDGVAIVRLDAEYSAFSEEMLDELERQLLEIAENSAPPAIILDFSETRYFSSSFLELLFRVWDRLHRRGGRLLLCELHEYCHESLRAARLDSIWAVADTVADSLARLKRGA